MTTATVKLWGTPVGYLAMDKTEQHARFEFDPIFADIGVELAPLQMPVRIGHIYQFRDLHPRSFYGLPGLIADSLPDKFGNKLIDVWYSQFSGKTSQFNAVDQLCYIGTGGMGAFEYEPSIKFEKTRDTRLELHELIDLATLAYLDTKKIKIRFKSGNETSRLLDLLRAETFAGGARAKAVIVFNPKTKKIRLGQHKLPKDFEHWLIKLDGVSNSGDWGVADPSGFGLLEYSYYLMAKKCSINMMKCEIFSENGRDHFMTKRFDRDEQGQKKFIQTFAAMTHFDYYDSGAYSYEQLFMTMRKLNMPQSAFEEQFRRVVFNLVGCNQDDHVKNFSFMMARNGDWDISPAYDLCHAEGSNFTSCHQLSINGKLKDFSLADLKHLAQFAQLPRNREKIVLEQTLDAFSSWLRIARTLKIPKHLQDHVQRTLRLSWT